MLVSATVWALLLHVMFCGPITHESLPYLLLMQNLKLMDGDWKLDVISNMALIQMAHKHLTAIDNVPSNLRPIHESLIDATSDCKTSTDFLASGLDSLSADDVERATAYMERYTLKLQSTREKIDGYVASTN